MLPMMMTDENGLQKCIFNERTANELKQKVAFTKKQEQKDLAASIASRHGSKGTHGLAPSGMTIPRIGNAFRVGGVASSKKPLKESNQEKYKRIKAEQEDKVYKKNKRAVKKLKREGKVSTLALFMYS